MKVGTEYKKEKCDKKGKHIESNLDKETDNAIKKLKKRVVKENLAIYQTDKTAKFVLDSLENLENKMKKHTEKHRKIGRKQFKKIQNSINNHTRHWLQFLNTGRDVKQTKRTCMNLINDDNPLPLLRGTAKDHKPNFDPVKGPELRPIMGAKVGPNTGLSQIGCKILKKVLEKKNDKKEVKSTEELMAKFKEYNSNRSEETGQQVVKSKTVGSMDIKSFYPSICPNRAAEISRSMFEKSDVEIENVNFDILAKYLGKFLTNEKIDKEDIRDLVYTKKPKEKKKIAKKISKKANRSKSLVVRNIEKKKKVEIEEENWLRPKKLPNSTEAKRMLGIALELLIVTCMSNHMYKFNGERRLQDGEGPTGLDLTGLVADIYMLWWDDQYIEKLTELGFVSDLYTRFKDDVNVISEVFGPKI